MSYPIEKNDGKITVFLTGEVDLEKSPEARKQLLQSVENGDQLVVDMSKVSYIDSSGVASLVETLQACKKKDIPLTLANVSEPALKVIRLARLEKVFHIEPQLA